MDIIQMIEQAQDKATVKRVFGEPIVQDGITVIPVARVAGGGGGGSGKQEGDNPAEGLGAGFGLGASPAGVFVIKDGTVRWQPVVDVNKVIIGGQFVLVVALLTIRTIARLRARRR
ncbi:spore germination protein GerW family protein [Microtetraspora fusca]|uniref:Spore germination protein GerW family protein n=1 Tax=Microtetraspora fusca TaxID=1997 RepID=A0ABW6VF56_MICFU|nr:spore germination protein GerW family protein [Microtetraspora fusca]